MNMQYGVIGERLGHSFSREIHNLLADYDYSLREIPREELPRFMMERAFKAINVTIPYKEAVIPFLSEISPIAKRIGAVNTIVNRGGELYGDNTDYYGLKRLILKNIDPAGKTVLILGSGGTSKTAAVVMEDLNAKEIVRVSRSAKDGAVTYPQAETEWSHAQIILNTTPCGMYPNNGQRPIDIGKFPKLCCVIDAIYNPLRSALVLDALERGLPAEGGLYMLVAQAVRAVEVFTDSTLPEDALDKVYRKILQSKENIVLTGMPGCGKTTVGALLAETTGRPVIDLDEEIVSKAGCSIADIFAAQGEKAFRDLEEEAIRDAAEPRTGCIISTGGGAILRESNIRRLRANGKLIFLDRPLEALLPTEDRPLAKDREAIRRRYEERYDRYCQTADIRIPVAGTPEQAAQQIIKEFFQ